MSDVFVLSTARNWVASVIFQGNRVLELEAKDAPPEGQDRFFAWAEERRKRPDFTHIEDHFFVTATSKSVEWILESHKRDLLNPDLTESFLNAAGQSKLVRNIREHYLEYLNGGGRQRKQDKVLVTVNGETLTAEIDASSVIVTDEGRLIGGRLNVQQLMREAKDLETKLVEHVARLVAAAHQG